MKKFRSMEIMQEEKRKILCYNKDDMGNKYKIYCKSEETNNFYYYNSFKTYGEAKQYFDKIY